jgi:hypothetical protein
MGTVHRLIMEHGVEAARNAAETKSERQAIDAAAAIMVEEESRLGITHAGFAMTALPHRRIEEPFWERSGYQTILQVESGRLPGGKLVGVTLRQPCPHDPPLPANGGDPDQQP